MIQENASLKFELQGLMDRNLALQNAFSHTSKEVPVVNFVENVNLNFPTPFHHSAFFIPQIVQEYGRYYDGNIFIKKQDCVQLDATEHTREYINHLLVVLFGRDVLKRSCVTGQMSNRFRDKDRKPPLDPVKLQLIYSKLESENQLNWWSNVLNELFFLSAEMVAARTKNDREYSNSVINRIIAKKIYNLLAADKRAK